MKEYKIGDIVKGKVTGVEDYGIFILLDDGTTGLIHISEISEGFVREVSDYAEIGEILSAKVIDYDHESGKLKLSIKDDKNRKEMKISPIKETNSGFKSLSVKLGEWIAEKSGEQ